jgi:hypothetical protein
MVRVNGRVFRHKDWGWKSKRNRELRNLGS